ncbi:MAG: glycosyltransferase family 2 protein, partial [Bacteroidaceae bacterium]|nr:glycosyltransferase family 2 protein [Bacteroidaceae bacterium]
MIYLVIPCYNEQEVLVDTTEKLAALIGRMPQEDVRVLYTDDGSRDATWQLICQMHERHPFVEGIRLAHNEGHQHALWAGMEAAAGRAEAIISIDADLQDDIEVIPRMVADFRQGADIVYGVRHERATDSAFKRFTALAFYRVMNALGSHIVYNHADFRLLSRRALLALLSYPE